MSLVMKRDKKSLDDNMLNSFMNISDNNISPKKFFNLTQKNVDILKK